MALASCSTASCPPGPTRSPRRSRRRRGVILAGSTANRTNPVDPGRRVRPGSSESMRDMLSPPPHLPARSVRVLLVDDDTELGELVREYLARQDCSLEVEADGTRAVDRALAGDYRLIVLDVMLPGVSGFDILRHLRAASRIPVTPRPSAISSSTACGSQCSGYHGLTRLM